MKFTQGERSGKLIIDWMNDILIDIDIPIN